MLLNGMPYPYTLTRHCIYMYTHKITNSNHSKALKLKVKLHNANAHTQTNLRVQLLTYREKIAISPFLLKGTSIVIVLSNYDCQQLKCTQFHSSYVANGKEKESNKTEAKNKVKNNRVLLLLLLFSFQCGTQWFIVPQLVPLIPLIQ